VAGRIAARSGTGSRRAVGRPHRGREGARSRRGRRRAPRGL